MLHNWGWQMVKVNKFDAIDYLDSEEMIIEYLAAAEESGNSDILNRALADVAKARERIRKSATDKNFSR